MSDRACATVDSSRITLKAIRNPDWHDAASGKWIAKISEVAVALYQQAQKTAAAFGGFESDVFYGATRQLLRTSPAHWAQKLGTFSHWEEIFHELPVPLQDIAALGHVRQRLLAPKNRKVLRRRTLRQLTQRTHGKRFSILTTTLQAFADDPSTQSLLEMALRWKNHSTYQDPRFAQLVSRLIKRVIVKPSG